MSSLGTFDIGDQVKVTATFVDFAGVLTTPTAVKFQVEQADGTETSYTQAAPEVANPSTGVWTLLITLTANDPGRWYVRTRGTAFLLAADEDWFDVKRSVFTVP